MSNKREPYFLQGVDGTWMLVLRGDEEYITKIMEMLTEWPDHVKVPPEISQQVYKLDGEWFDRDRKDFSKVESGQEDGGPRKGRKRNRVKKARNS